ncbi:MAG TPA: DUF4388 domain-containing protein [Vicinamibacteria bacterium]|nr:DUF4388 domain-containing protein [Vicinamibacteria bacterium]
MSFNKRIPFEGVLNCWNDEHDLPDLLLAICRAKKSGQLSFSNPEGDKTIHIQHGRIVFARSSSADDGLGHFLLRAGKISLVDYLRISKLVEPGKRLGALLVSEGILEAKELLPVVMGQVRAIILGLFRRTETWYRFRPGALDKESITLEIPTEKLVFDGIRQVDSWRRISKGVGDLESFYARVESKEGEWRRFGLAEGALELIDMLSEAVSVAHICTHATLPDFEACRYLWAFRCLGWVTSADARTQPRAAQSGVVTRPSAAPPESVPRAAIPPALIQTRVSVNERPLPPPETIPQDLAETRYAFETHASRDNPRTVVTESERTQLFIEPETPQPSTGEMMEAILNEEGPTRPKAQRPESPGGSKTPFVGTGATLGSTDKTPAGFEVLALDGQSKNQPSSIPSLPSKPEDNGANCATLFDEDEETSFRDLAYLSDETHLARRSSGPAENPTPIGKAPTPAKAIPPIPPPRQPDPAETDLETGGLAHLLSLDD